MLLSVCMMSLPEPLVVPVQLILAGRRHLLVSTGAGVGAWCGGSKQLARHRHTGIIHLYTQGEVDGY